MSTFSLKRSHTADVSYTLLDADGAAFDVDGYTVTLVIAGRGVRLQKVGVSDTPSTLGTGVFSFVSADYDTLRPGDYAFEVYVDDGDTQNIPMLSGTLTIVDVPQRL
jgi:hypothetical protein